MIKHVVTLGFGFADGVAFIPTIGFTPGEAIAVASLALTLPRRTNAVTLPERTNALSLPERTNELDF